MGLDLCLARLDNGSDRARWSYSGFNAFRERLARRIGISLEAMTGFGGEVSWSTVQDPIVPLLNHSDCEGELEYADCEQVAPRLRELVASWPENDYDRQMAERLASMMDEVAAGDAWKVVFR